MKLYTDLAAWWPLMSPPEEYASEAAFYHAALQRAAGSAIETVLELGSGGGHNAAHMKGHYREMVLVDLSPGMLEVSRAINPELEHRQGDMRDVRLGRQFDAVFVHDAICYMTSESDLRRTFETAFVHCRPRGVALFCPDYVRENFAAGAGHGGTDAGARGMRWLEWCHDPGPGETTYVVDYAYLLREPGGAVRVEHDRHVEGLFARETWLRLLGDAGFRCEVVPFEHPDVDPGAHEVFLCVRPASAG